MSMAPALAPVTPAAPATRDSWPLRATAKLLTVLVAALAEKAKRPSGVTAIQQAAPWPLASDGVTTIGVAERSLKRYDEAALPAASETIRMSRLLKAKPKGTAPDDGETVLSASVPSRRTRKLVKRCVPRSVTTSTSPSSLKPTWPGAVPVLADRVPTAPAMGRSTPRWLRKPLTPPLPPALST